jgi:hypothetical protein
MGKSVPDVIMIWWNLNLNSQKDAFDYFILPAETTQREYSAPTNIQRQQYAVGCRESKKDESIIRQPQTSYGR